MVCPTEILSIKMLSIGTNVFHWEFRTHLKVLAKGDKITPVFERSCRWVASDDQAVVTSSNVYTKREICYKTNLRKKKVIYIYIYTIIS